MKIVRDRLEFLVWIGSIAVGITVFVYSTFTTQAALEEKEKSILQYVDEKHNGVDDRLERIESLLERIDSRVYDLSKQK